MPTKYTLLAVAVLVACSKFAHAAEGVQETPLKIAPLQNGVGRLAPDVAGTGIDGKAFQLSKWPGDRKLTIIAATSTSCPLCKKYLPTLADLEKTLAAKGVGLVLLNPIATDKLEDMATAVKATGVRAPYLHDKDGSIARSLGFTSSTEVVLLDSKRTVIYRGAVDDQYGLGYSADAPKRNFLRDAIANHLDGKLPAIQATSAPGCVLDLASAKVVETPVTYHNRISRIVQSHCLDCHRKGGGGPFELETRDDLLAHKGMIKKVVAKATMPPWGAVLAKGEHSPFVNDRSLPEVDKAVLLAWFEANAPVGEPVEAPLPRSYPKDWAIGKPDLVLQIPKAIAIKATGTMAYQRVVVDTNFDEDKWIQAIEVRPTAKAGVVHHILAFPIGPGKDVPRGAEAGGHVAAYVPGNTAQIYPTGYAKKLSKGGRLLLQIHYTPNGTATEDRTEIGFVFSKDVPHTEVKVFGLANPRLNIAPGESNYEKVAELKLPFDATLLGFAPHMHVRGKACKYEATFPDGKTRVLLDVPHYDFNWQVQYELAEPLVLPRGTTLKYTAWYDNSTANPANPDPKATVKWGPQTSDEMMLGYVGYFLGKPKAK